jgi:tetratricopeptide (TPR) repeat protein
MADLAHNASGPASSEPAGIAVREAGRSVSSDRGKLRVFISYSRDDLDFADQLTAALDFSGFECSIDREGISGGEEWKRSLSGLISEADTVVFVLTPNSARSAICDWEVEEATRLNKRILPIVCRPLEGVSPPPRLRELNYIFFYKEPKVPGSGFGTGLAKLVTALNTDFDWLREHTRYLQRAIEWDAGGRPTDRLLSGNDILEAKAWAARRPKGAHEPTALHLDFIRASEEEAEARLSEQRKQLEAVAAAQAARETALHEAEEALKQAADAQRRRARIRNIAFVIVSGFALVAGMLYLKAEEERQTANFILTETQVIFRRTRDRIDFDTQKDFFFLFRMAAERGDDIAMGFLGGFYADGFGVAKDYTKAREWLEKAVAKGYTAATYTLEQLPIREAADAGRYAEALQYRRRWRRNSRRRRRNVTAGPAQRRQAHSFPWRGTHCLHEISQKRWPSPIAPMRSYRRTRRLNPTGRTHSCFWGTMKRQKRSTVPTKGSLFPGRTISYGSALSLRTLRNSARRA